jgi:hypothetical protein
MGANSCRTGSWGDGERLALKVVTATTPVAFFSRLDVMQLSHAQAGELAWENNRSCDSRRCRCGQASGSHGKDFERPWHLMTWCLQKTARKHASGESRLARFGRLGRRTRDTGEW